MVGWIAFILGVSIVGLSAIGKMGYFFCVPVAFGWYVLLLNSSKKLRKQ
jgi:hypothetical protein